MNNFPLKNLRALKLFACAVISVGFLSGFTSCSSSSGPENPEGINQGGSSSSTGLDYEGPDGATDDVTAFQEHLWNNLVSEDRCGACHKQGGSGTSSFVRDDDINAAYQAVLPLVDLDIPTNSQLVARMNQGHNCWDNSTEFCADQVKGWIENWANEGNEKTTVSILPLSTDELVEPGDSYNFPVDPTLFETHLYRPILSEYCVNCHQQDAPVTQAPHLFAQQGGPETVLAAYAVAKNFISLNNPASSRFVSQLRSLHNCWVPDGAQVADCNANADEIEAAIGQMVAGIEQSQVDPSLVASFALPFPLAPGQRQSANSTGRFESNVIAKYEFKQLDASDPTRVLDTSGVDPQMDLTLFGEARFLSSWGIEFTGPSGRAQSSTRGSRKLHDNIRLTGEFAIEAWVIPNNVTQDNTRRIISYSAGNDERNFTLGQTLYDYDVLLRNTSENAMNNGTNGEPIYSTPTAEEVLQASLQHVVVNYDSTNGRQIYVDGVLRSTEADVIAGGTLSNWDENFVFVLGNEAGSVADRDWKGILRFVAIHNKTLAPEEIAVNASAGVGQKYYFPFFVGELFGIGSVYDKPDGAYIVFEVERFDDKSYLFSNPFFTILDKELTLPTGGVIIRGMRIGVNGSDEVPGQAFANMDIHITQEMYQAAENNWVRFANFKNQGDFVFNVPGTIIGAVKTEPEQDEFFLTFDSFGANSSGFVRSLPQTEPLTTGQLTYQQPDIGMKHFYELNEMYSAITGVPKTDVATTFNQLKTSLPANEDAVAFATSNQMGVAQLAAAYCEVASQQDQYRGDLWPGVVIDQPLNNQTSAVLGPLLERMAATTGLGLTTQPDPNGVTSAIDRLMTEFSAAENPGDDNGKATLTAVCTAVLSSALGTVQ